MIEKLKSYVPIAAYWLIGIATVIVADRAGMVHQSNPVYYWLGAFLRAWLWPMFWFDRAREALLGF